MTTPLVNNAMLASLNISQWTARKHDKRVSDEVDKNHGAKNAGRYNKLLIAKEALEPIEQLVGSARKYHYHMTLAWNDNGDRLLPSKLFMNYTIEMNKFSAEFELRVQRLARDYPAHVQDARTRLGTMYDPTNYPDNITERFSFGVSFSPVPSSGDFRVAISSDQAEAIRRDIEARTEARQRKAVEECWQRVREIITPFHKLNDDSRIYDSLVDNARKLIGVLPALNITGDPKLEQIATEIDALLVPPNRLREDKDLRKQTADAASDILAKLPWL